MDSSQIKMRYCPWRIAVAVFDFLLAHVVLPLPSYIHLKILGLIMFDPKS